MEEGSFTCFVVRHTFTAFNPTTTYFPVAHDYRYQGVSQSQGLEKEYRLLYIHILYNNVYKLLCRQLFVQTYVVVTTDKAVIIADQSTMSILVSRHTL